MTQRKIVVIIVIAVLVIFGFLQNSSEAKDCINARIIPNSNEETDTLVKEMVVIEVKNYLLANYSEDYVEYSSNIVKTLNDLEEDLISKYGLIKVEFTEHTLYNKTYNDSALKNKEALTLLVTIGDGAGDNWWGTVFPDYLAKQGSEEVKYTSYIEELIERIFG